MEVKFVGFDKAIDKNIRSAKTFEQMLLNELNDQTKRGEIVQYLDKGHFLTGVMSFIYDDEKRPIGNLDYFTDGHFVWPRYYIYYVKKYPNFLIDEELYVFAKQNNFAIASLSKETINSIEKTFDLEWTGKRKE